MLEEPAIRARAYPVSVKGFHQMIEHGTVAENVELIRGALVEKMSKSSLHTRIVMRLLRWLMSALPAGHSVRPEQPLTLADSEPEPDLAVVKGDDTAVDAGHPTTAEMIVEVCVSSEALDRLKLQLYAEAGVRECWLVLAEQRVLERHSEPAAGGYRRVERSTDSEPLASTVFAELQLPPDGLFPE